MPKETFNFGYNVKPKKPKKAKGSGKGRKKGSPSKIAANNKRRDNWS